MILTALEIHRLPGIASGFRIEPAASAVTVVTGPNASGKSSMGRAIRALLYPQPADGFCDLAATFRAGDQTWQVRRQGERVEWRLDGRTAPAPPLPAAENLGAFLIHSDELGGAGDTENRIAGRLRTVLAGGYDLKAVVDKPPLKIPPRPHRLSREFVDARRRADEREQAYAELAGELERIDGLAQAHAAAVAAQSRLEACDRAIEYCDTERELTATAGAVERYPEAMARLQGDELERLERLEQAIGEKRNAIEAAGRKLDAARAAFADTGIEDCGGMEIFQAELSDLRQQLKESEDRLDDLKRLAGEQEAVLADARRRAGGEVDAPSARLDAARLDRLDRLVEQVRDLRQRETTARRQFEQLKAEGADGRRIEHLNQACQSLRRWLRKPMPTWPEVTIWAGLAGLGVVSSITVALTGLRLEIVMLMLLATLVPAGRLVTLGLGYQHARAARELFPAARVEPPVGWTWEEVVSRLEDLEQELARVRRAYEDSTRHAALAEEIKQLEPERRQAEATVKELAEKLGLASELRLTSGFLLWCRAVLDWQQAARRLADNRSAREASAKEIKAIGQQIAGLFERYRQPLPDPLDSRALGRFLNQLRPTLEQAHGAANAIEQGERRLEELKADLAELESRRAQLFSDAGLDDGARDELRRRLGERNRYARLVDHQGDLKRQLDRLRNALADAPDLLELAKNADQAGLQDLREELAEKAARRDELKGQMAALEARHADVLDRRDLEQLNRAQETCRLELEEALEAHLLATAGKMLVDQARKAHRSLHQPRVLTRAAEWFARFTRYQYALSFEDERFEAVETARNRVRGLAELSTGTRVQLLLAVRLAWLDEAERGRESLPLILDEVLSTADPDRYRSVVDALQKLVKNGRQVIYLSAQDADAEAWRRFAGEPAPKCIGMQEIRQGAIAAGEAQIDFTLPERRRWPDPKGTTPGKWAREAGIRPFDPWADAGGVDLFYLLRDDLSLLADFKRAGIENLGQFEQWLAFGAEGIELEPERRKELEQRTRAARAWFRTWRRGRSRPVTGSVLAESGAITETFMPPVSALAEELAGEPEALLKALRERKVPRFRQRNAELLESWLGENGYLDGREPASRTEIIAAMAADSSLNARQAAELGRWLSAGAAPAEPQRRADPGLAAGARES